MKIWILSPMTTPPPSMGMLVVMPKSCRLISAVPENPARVPPNGSRVNPLTSSARETCRVTLLGTSPRPRRFADLRRSVDGISQRMLTVTLRGLERDGLVVRTVHATVPPQVDYTLTPLGHTLLDTVSALVGWADQHLPEIFAARAAYDRQAALLSASLNGHPDDRA